MARGTMITFIVVVGQNLPVIVACHLPCMVKLVVVKVELLASLLLIYTLEFIIPANFWFGFAIQIDPDEAVVVNVDMDRKEAVLCLIKPGNLIIPWSLGQLAIQSVRPAMIPACEYLR